MTGEELTAGQRVAAGGMAAGYIPIVGWAGRIFKGGKSCL
ncbi:pre-toxin TG domain-containing protein [Bacillus sp. SL00103]